MAKDLIYRPGSLNLPLKASNKITSDMKSKLLSILAFILFTTTLSQAQVNINQVMNSANSLLGQGLSNDKIVKGLKEALTVGTKNSTEKASKVDGFFKNPLIKIPFPKEARQMEETLKSMGMKKEVDRFVQTLNRAAEDASKKAAPIFINAVTNMSISDGLKILRGSNSAATDFLKGATSVQLKNEFKPVVKTSLKKVEITRYWNPLAKNYNKIPMVKKVNPNLDDYVTTKAIDGLFKLIAAEELKIRKDPQARISEILKEVFGSN